MGGGGERVAKMMGGKKADAYLTDLANGVSTKAGLPPPAHVYEIPTNELNAFAAGFGRKDATVAVTSGLRKALNKKELEAVIAHEIGHIRHSDMSTKCTSPSPSPALVVSTRRGGCLRARTAAAAAA